MVVELFFHPLSPPSQAIRMILKELNIDYKEIIVDVFFGTPLSEEFLKVNPKRKVPAIRDGSLCLAESRAIAMYLCTKYEPDDKPNKLYPKQAEEVAKMNAALMEQIDDDFFVDRYTNARDVFEDRGYGPLPESIEFAKTALKHMEESLENRKYLFADHVTILDFFALATSQMLDIADDKIWSNYPRVTQWRQLMSQKPYYQEYSSKPTSESGAYYKEQSEKKRPK